MRLYFAVFFVTLLTVLVLINLYVVRRATRAFGLSRRARRGLAGALALVLLSAGLGRAVSQALPQAPLRALLAAAFTLELAVIFSATLLWLIDLATLVARAGGRAARAREPAPSAPSELPVAPRRAFLTRAATGSAFLIGTSSSLYGALAGRHDYTVEDVPIRLDGLGKALDGFCIVQLSDIHIGQFVGPAELAAAESLVRSARPDLIVLTGDLLDNDARLAPLLGRFVERLAPAAREGVVAISGNHDYYAGIAPFVTSLKAGRAEVLRNRGRVIGGRGGFALLGVDDVRAPRFELGGGPDLTRAIESLPAVEGKLSVARDLPRVLLCHNPVYFEDAAGRVALQLSGHTHGGQINPGIRPASWVLQNGWVAGLYERRGSRLYVNRGFGTVGPPVRLGAAPEITRIVLTA